jgi:sRNA-binding protein
MRQNFNDQDHRAVIELLAQVFPKTFFVAGFQRRPLKKNIVADIERVNDPSLASFDIGDAVDFYINHWDYDAACSIAGADRINLEGKAVGKITEAEAREARQRRASKKAMHAATYEAENEAREEMRRKIPSMTIPPITDGELQRRQAALVAERSSGAEQKLRDALAALNEVPKLRSVESASLRLKLVQSVISVADASLKEMLKELG